MTAGFMLVGVLVLVITPLYCVSKRKSPVTLGIIFVAIHLVFFLYFAALGMSMKCNGFSSSCLRWTAN